MIDNSKNATPAREMNISVTLAHHQRTNDNTVTAESRAEDCRKRKYLGVAALAIQELQCRYVRSLPNQEDCMAACTSLLVSSRGWKLGSPPTPTSHGNVWAPCTPHSTALKMHPGASALGMERHLDHSSRSGPGTRKERKVQGIDWAPGKKRKN